MKTCENGRIQSHRESSFSFQRCESPGPVQYILLKVHLIPLAQQAFDERFAELVNDWWFSGGRSWGVSGMWQFLGPSRWLIEVILRVLVFIGNLERGIPSLHGCISWRKEEESIDGTRDLLDVFSEYVSYGA